MGHTGISIKYKDIGRLLKSGKDRKKQGRYIVEGIKMVLEAIVNASALKIFVSEEWWSEYVISGRGIPGKSSAYIKEQFERCGYEIVGNRTFKELTDTVNPQGVLAVAEFGNIEASDIIKEAAKGEYSRLLILENLQDPGNLGTIIRTAEAAGFRGIIMNKGTADMYSPKVVRATMGAIFRVPCAYNDTTGNIVSMCKDAGITVYGAALEGNDIRQENFDKKLAFIIGNESAGIAPETKKLCGKLVKIPMCGSAESLNASVAAAVLMYMSNLTFL
ncbi:MAG: RNA methyltransferase [Lachnospiraceae bacterium]|nr:RNA methyltransferase [Lachnospiraceae bacterium]